MKIIVFVEDFGATGVVRNAIAFTGRLAELGHNVTLLAAKPDGVLRATVPDAVLTASLNERSEEGSRKTLMRQSFGPFRKFVTREKPDIVFSSGNHGHLLVLGGTRFLPCRTIVRISNDLEHRNSEREVGRWHRWRRKLKFRTILSLADRVVLVSHGLLEQVVSLDPSLGRKAVVIPNGVDVGAVRAQSAGATFDDGYFEGSPIVLAMGRLVPQKNFGTLLEAVATARRTADVRLLLIGTGPLLPGLHALARSLRIEDAVRIVEPVPNPFPIMKRSAVMVLPSWWEGSSNVLLEAVACGTPVVASRTAGSAAEILSDDRYGLLVDPTDADGMAAAILRQVGPDAVRPGARAQDYERRAALDAYAELVAGMA